MLHDFRLFVPNLHFIWKRFINVIFVKQYDETRRGNVSFGVWFELSTVPFPMPINKIFVTKQLDFWRGGRYRHGTKLNLDKAINLEGFFTKRWLYMLLFLNF